MGVLPAAALKNFDGNAPSSPAAIAEFERVASVRLPTEYREFLLAMNGGSGRIGAEGWAVFWRLEELRSLNEAYEFEQYAPGVLAFGSDGGGEAFAFDLETPGMPIVMIPFIGMARDVSLMVGRDFSEFLDRMARGEHFPNP